MQEKLAICLLASEVEPLSKTGGLADVAGALTRSLHRAGHDVRLFTPCYASIDRAGIEAEPVAGLQGLRLALGPNHYVFSVLHGRLPGGAPVHLIDCPELYARGGAAPRGRRGRRRNQRPRAGDLAARPHPPAQPASRAGVWPR